ncbi:hypothetical protein DPMN_109966 [Dreissena polymorpha]|uniref:Uncharacterized protein n=1 Tax=Dreissena polymorpha TaxID=45954 RepID=A0A9D4QNJ2_DREPO|nr:hypothetical protein DPMN_109966 [Dreissena polymorpha]
MPDSQGTFPRQLSTPGTRGTGGTLGMIRCRMTCIAEMRVAETEEDCYAATVATFVLDVVSAVRWTVLKTERSLYNGLFCNSECFYYDHGIVLITYEVVYVHYLLE